MSGRAGDDDVLVLPPLPADPLFVDAVEDAVAGGTDDLPNAQPERRVGADPREFASLYMRHRTSFGLHARRFLHDSRDVEEVLQEAFLRLFLAMPELETELQALAYCRRTVTNLCIDRYRADQRRPRLVDLDAIEWDPSDEASYDDPVLRAEDAAIVRQALALLTPMHRAALVKREIEEKPLPVIAAELGIPEDSVKHLLYRARRALRRLLVGTSVEPGADLSNAELLRLANERLARATLRSANVLIVLFVAAVTVVGALRIGVQDQQTRSSDLGATVTPPLGGAQGNPAHRLAPAAHPQSKSPRAVRKPAAVTSPASQPRIAPVAPAAPARHHESFTPRAPRPQHHDTAPSLPTGPPAGTFTINAPVLGAVGTAAVRTDTVELKPTGEWANTSTFRAPTTTGDFALQQVTQRSTEGVVSSNLLPILPATDPSSSILVSSNAASTPTADGNVLVNVELLVVTPPSGDGQAASVPPLDISVRAVYTPDVTRVLAEQVNVVEGFAPCCDSPATTTPPSAASGGGTSSLPTARSAVGSASVSPMSTSRRDDQAPASSS
jgi:RNA polymerase sigma-70 factor (ECF subfamily)